MHDASPFQVKLSSDDGVATSAGVATSVAAWVSTGDSVNEVAAWQTCAMYIMHIYSFTNLQGSRIFRKESWLGLRIAWGKCYRLQDVDVKNMTMMCCLLASSGISPTNE